MIRPTFAHDAAVVAAVRIADSWADPGERSGLFADDELHDPDAADLLTGLAALVPDLLSLHVALGAPGAIVLDAIEGEPPRMTVDEAHALGRELLRYKED